MEFRLLLIYVNEDTPAVNVPEYNKLPSILTFPKISKAYPEEGFSLFIPNSPLLLNTKCVYYVSVKSGSESGFADISLKRF